MTDTPTPPLERTGRRRKPKVRHERAASETVDTDWRVFLAVPLPADVVARVGEIVAALQPRGLPMRWVAPDSAHVTLHFLGETPPEQVEIVRLALPAILAGHTAFDLRTAGLGVFPRLRKPRVLWMGLWGPTHRLEAIYNDLGDLLDDFGFPIEEREFQPHITLGRVRDTMKVAVRDVPEALRNVIAEMEENGLADPKRPLPVPVREVQLLRSHLDEHGARYELIARFPLAAVVQTPADTGV